MDNEPLTAHDIASMEEGWRNYEQGNTISREEHLRRISEAVPEK